MNPKTNNILAYDMGQQEAVIEVLKETLDRNTELLETDRKRLLDLTDDLYKINKQMFETLLEDNKL